MDYIILDDKSKKPKTQKHTDFRTMLKIGLVWKCFLFYCFLGVLMMAMSIADKKEHWIIKNFHWKEPVFKI